MQHYLERVIFCKISIETLTHHVLENRIEVAESGQRRKTETRGWVQGEGSGEII